MVYSFVLHCLVDPELPPIWIVGDVDCPSGVCLIKMKSQNGQIHESTSYSSNQDPLHTIRKRLARKWGDLVLILQWKSGQKEPHGLFPKQATNPKDPLKGGLFNHKQNAHPLATHCCKRQPTSLRASTMLWLTRPQLGVAWGVHLEVSLIHEFPLA